MMLGSHVHGMHEWGELKRLAATWLLANQPMDSTLPSLTDQPMGIAPFALQR